ncbi:Alpha-1,3-mannosyl-glycoprotein 4-beta-N-acetylglucosaminyltransferase B [Pteropus alecto]|uniref:Alpha-1,3-mannosyl-glycoprotein 4-beta-N-acetylglucosaminyltransferase B n=1 Tax=Pteropus alecto TaxID=9402 RepID=L5L4J1_PTEAL|nr:Alpha-1,3-mannosyl-glycoprotein 4-beta-N-acetylglucosaminyltransferase B [Pteropus alecto]
MILRFSQLGIIGQMFKSLDLSLIVESIIVFYRDKPIDWLLDRILWVKVCNPEKNAKLWDPHKAYLRVRFNLSLFQFVSTQSLLAGGQDPETEGQGLGEAGIAGRVLQHTGGGEHEPRDLAALPPSSRRPCLGILPALQSTLRRTLSASASFGCQVRSGSCSAAGVTLTTWLQALQHLCGSAACPLITSSRTREIGMRAAQPHSGALGALMATATLAPSTECGRGRGGGWPSVPGSTAPLHPDRLTDVGHSDWHLP